MPSTRRTYSKSFKAQIVQEYSQPGSSIAQIALSHGINANLVHKWIRLHNPSALGTPPAFVPVKMSPAAPATTHPGTIRVEVPHPRGTMVVSWSLESAATATAFLRDLLR
ncbi:IS66-like element accessory protein TnpA [Pseudomonas sp. MWU13-2105]|uniref:IS66-like element accessory protein TnpA n=1 Tax=Pseudomonas sp. MWU13-2105 TaxID=2935074 RepID=UPI00200D8BD6|nr:transposase [Pseudomonas sp. MWU13-2105]